jgi:hypothetical protein
MEKKFENVFLKPPNFAQSHQLKPLKERNFEFLEFFQQKTPSVKINWNLYEEMNKNEKEEINSQNL